MAGTPMTPITGVDKGQEYDFRGAQANDAFGVLLKGSANAVGDFIEGEYKAGNLKLREEARTQVDAMGESLFAQSDIAAAQASTTKGGVAPPEDLVKGFDKLSGIKNAYMKGALTESDYLANVDVITKKLRQRWGPSWSDEIDSAVEAAVGSSANRYRKQLFNEWDAQKSAAQSAAEKEDNWKYNFVKENIEFLGPHLEEVTGDLTGISKGQLIAWAAPGKVQKEKMTQEKAYLELKKANNEDYFQSVLETGKKDNSQYISNQLTTSTNSNKKGWFEALQAAKADGSISKDEKEKLSAYLVELENSISDHTEKMLLEDTYVRLPENMKEDIRKQGKELIDLFKNQMFNEQYGAVNMFKNSFKWASEETFLEAMKISPDFANNALWFKSLSDAGFGDYFDESMKNRISTSLDAENPDISLAYRSAGDILLGKTPLRTYLAAVSQARKSPKMVGDVMRILREGLSSDSSSIEDRAAAAKVMFDPENSDIFSSGQVTPGLATDMFNDMTHPGVIKAMREIYTNDPQAFDNYYNWAFDSSFKSIFQKEINDISVTQVHNKLDFDENTFKFVVKGKGDVWNKGAGGNANDPRSKQYIEYEQKMLNQTANRLNIWITHVRPLIQIKGLEPDAEILRLLNEQSLPVNAKEGKGSILEPFREKLRVNVAAKEDPLVETP